MNCLRRLSCCLCALLLAAWLASAAWAQTVARCGQGWLEHIDGYPVLHLEGTPYEMGFQHGALLKESVRQNLRNILQGEKTAVVEVKGVTIKPRWAFDAVAFIQRPFVPEAYLEELRGLADGAAVPLADLTAANFLPELFHCSGFAVMNTATVDGTLYHGRVLDYAVDWKLQEHAVLIVARPRGGLPFVNVGYAGFIGSVTGMNAEKVSIGEMGGRGLGHWQGVPMALLVREVLQKATDLDAAVDVFRSHRRTCQYFYVIADGKTNRALGMEASWNKLQTVGPGEVHPLLPQAVPDCVLLSAGPRYETLVGRARREHGRIDAQAALRLMDRPVAGRSNLHNVLFAPQSTRFWVANASRDGGPAAEQPYQEFQLSELLQRQPDPTAPALAASPEATEQSEKPRD
jgi:isopenicillin-N N-acyltransferase-like protein